MIRKPEMPGLKEFGQAHYEDGYRSGLLGKPFTGSTFIGYQGWLAGLRARNVEEGHED